LRSASSFAIVTGLIVGGTSTAHAQDTKTAVDNTGSVAPEQVIVTANKRKQKAQDVDLDLTVLSGSQLKNPAQIKSTQDVVNFIPNAQGATTEGQTRPRYFVRGIGTNNVNYNAINPLGTYYDDIYIANVYDQALPIWDLDHVEALEGPQGTLWGKNANAGAINFISKAPTFTPDAYVKLGYGSFDTLHGEGAVSDALVPGKLAGRFSFFYDSTDGWQHNVWNNQQYGSGTNTALRQQFLITPTDDLSILLNFHARKFNGDLTSDSYIDDLNDDFLKTPASLTAGSPYYSTAKGVATRPPALAYNDVDIAGPNTNKLDEKGASAKITWEQPKFTVTSITGYESNIWNEQSSSSYNAPFGATPYTLTTQNTTFWEASQELRIASPEKNRFTWLGGLYGFADSESSTTWTGNFLANPYYAGATNTGPAFGATVNSPQETYFPWTQTTHSYAAFVNLGYKITPRFKVNSGVRLTVEHTTIQSYFNYVPGTTSFTDGSAYSNPSNYTSFVSPNTTTPVVSGASQAQTQTPLTYDVTPEYKFTNNIRSYFRYAHGVLPGNYTFAPYFVGSGAAAVSVGTAQPLKLKPETLDAYEVGLKTQWLDRRLTLNGTIFHYDYDNAATNVPTPINGTTTVLFENAGTETVDGGDIELDDKVTDNLHIGGNAGWLRAVYGQDGVDVKDGISGQQVPRSPHLSGVLYASYNEELPFGGNLVWAGDTELKSKFYYYPTQKTQVTNSGTGLVDQQAQSAYALFNANLTWYPSAKSGTSVQFSVQNLFNQEYSILRLQDANGANGVYNGAPRSFLLSVTEKFF